MIRAGQMAMLACAPQRVVFARPDTTERRLRFTLQISNPENRALERPSVWLYGPMKTTGTQDLLEVQVSMPHELSIDALGQSIISLHLPSMAPLATRVVNISASLALRGEPIVEAISDASAWLGQDRFVEVGDASIRELADQLRRQSQTETARAIYEWVRANIQYDRYLADEVGAREALRTRRGDCTEYAYLCTALARVNGIRARTMGGYIATADNAPRAADYHNWAQFHLLVSKQFSLDRSCKDFNAQQPWPERC
jgi:transglutaminase-like putative cysteine protease